MSCAQLEAQQELSKADDANALGAIKKNAEKVVKRDNIVLGISDLKQKKVDAKVAIGDAKNAVRSGQIVINPIDTIKVNNCEIVSKRPRSVTAAIFGNTSTLPKVEAASTVVNKTRAQSATAKIFRPNPQNVTSVTSKIFAPRTEEMNKGFLTFSEDEAGLTSKYLWRVNIEFCQKNKKNVA